MEWHGKRMDKYTEIIDFALKLEPAEQKEFVEAYAKTGPYALQNIGYFSGYYDPKTADRIMDVFQAAHPIFGRRHVSTEEALEMGKRVGRAAKRGAAP